MISYRRASSEPSLFVFLCNCRRYWPPGGVFPAICIGREDFRSRTRVCCCINNPFLVQSRGMEKECVFFGKTAESSECPTLVDRRNVTGRDSFPPVEQFRSFGVGQVRPMSAWLWRDWPMASCVGNRPYGQMDYWSKFKWRTRVKSGRCRVGITARLDTFRFWLIVWLIAFPR